MLLDDSSEHILNDSTDDLIRDSSLHEDLLDPYSGLDELGDVDPMQWGPEAFPNLAPLPEERSMFKGKSKPIPATVCRCP
jgi:hypothetical protein